MQYDVLAYSHFTVQSNLTSTITPPFRSPHLLPSLQHLLACSRIIAILSLALLKLISSVCTQSSSPVQHSPVVVNQH